MTQPNPETPHPLEIRLRTNPAALMARMIATDLEAPVVELPPSRTPDTSHGLLAICTACGLRMRTETARRQGLEYHQLPAHRHPHGTECPGQLTPAGCVLCPGCRENIVGYLPGDDVPVLLCGKCRRAAARRLNSVEEAELARRGPDHLYRPRQAPASEPS